MSKQYKPIETFWRVDENGCWLWQGCITKYGYGKYKKHERTYIAHRYVFELIKQRPIKEGMHLDHFRKKEIGCPRHCVNPDHLEEVTKLENDRRRDSCKLTKEKADEIRNLYRNGKSKIELAGLFNTTQQNIHLIIINQRWL